MIKSLLQSSLCSLTRTKVSPVEMFTKLLCTNLTNARSIHITSSNDKEFRVKGTKVRASDNSKYMSLEGEDTLAVQSTTPSVPLFPDAFTPDQLFDGVPFKQLHTINIKSTRNNTILTVTDYKGSVLLLRSAGIEGFKNAKKGTNIAAQQAALTLATYARERAIKTVKVRVQGIGAGRMSAIKGLQLGGMNIVSITDDTRVSWNPPRPRKQRRI